MKKYLYIVFVIIIMAVYSCGLDDPSPVPPPLAEDDSGKIIQDTSHIIYTHLRKDIVAKNVFGNFIPAVASAYIGTIFRLDLTNDDNNTELVLDLKSDIPVATSTSLSLVHAENAKLKKTIIQGRGMAWQATFPLYSATDTLNQPYIRAVETDPVHKTITEYRGYIADTTSTLNYICGTIPVQMDVKLFISAFQSTDLVIAKTQ